MSYLKQTLSYGLITFAVIGVGMGLYWTQEWPQPEPINAKIFPKLKSMAPFELTHGQQVYNQSDFEGRWSFVFFGYTYCPDVCPTTLSTLKQFFDQLPKEYQDDTRIVLVSVDPERDTPQQLQHYVEAFDPRFIGITGEHVALEPFARRFGAIYVKAGEGSDYFVDHTAKIFLVNPQVERHAYFDKSYRDPSEGYDYDIPQMVKDYKIIRANYLE